MAVDADMTDVIAANAESVLAARTIAPQDDLLIEVVIDLTDIDIDSLERQPEMAFGNLVKKRAEVKVSSLTPQKKKELVKAKDNELNTWLEHAVVEAASRKGIPAASMMKMRWVVTTKADDSLMARLVVQGFTDSRLGKILTAPPTNSRRARRLFLTTAASLSLPMLQGRCEVRAPSR